MILAADLGGTKTSLIFLSKPDLEAVQWEKEVLNKDYDDFYHLLRKVVPQDLNITTLIVGIAGPINEGVVDMTNLDWTVSEFELKKRFNLQNVKILNDLESLAYYLPYLTPDEKIMLKEGKTQRTGEVEVIVAVGTGLGKAVSLNFDQKYKVIKTEGGHTGFSPHNAEELAIHQYLLQNYDHVSNEMLCSSLGFRHISQYFLETQPNIFSNELKAALEKSQDFARTIIEFDTNKSSSGARTIIQKFIVLLGYYIGDQALSLMPGAIYIGGGIGNALEKYLKLIDFKEAVLKKGKMSPVVRSIPIYLIKKPNAGVLGAAVYGINIVKEQYFS